MEKGINLVGYSRAELGLGESCRSAAKVLERSGVPFGIINYESCVQRKQDLTWIHKEISKPKYQTNVIHINADCLQSAFLHFYKEKLFINRFNIGFWHWELPEFPDIWNDAFQFVNEIWVPSKFVKQSIEQKSPVPVVCMPHAVEFDIAESFDRNYFQLPERKFLFLTMFDIHSTQERKNPYGAINAFLRAFSKDEGNAGLVIKINSTNVTEEQRKDLQTLFKQISNNNNIYVIDKILTRDETLSLINCSNCLLSLHRSEGFGLPLAEAMYLGIPVIGTNWSGNTDFMNPENSLVVDYKLVQLDQDYGPYQKGQFWAEPDIPQAANYMRSLAANAGFSKMVGLKGQQTIKDKYSCKRVGDLMKARLDALNLL